MRRALWLALFALVSVRAVAADPPAVAVSIVEPAVYPERAGYTVTFQGAGAAAATAYFKGRDGPAAIRFGQARPVMLKECVAGRHAGYVIGDKDPGCYDNKTDTTYRTLTVHLRTMPAGLSDVALLFETDIAAGNTIVVSPSGPRVPRVVAAIVTLVLLGVVVQIIQARNKRTLTTGKKVNLLAALFIDSATNTYSLSTLQLYVWMVAGLSAYIYLLTSRVLAQDIWSLADIPASIVAVAGIAVGTTVASTGVNSVAGGPGSGAFNPSLADLISSGGSIAPERVQQLLWTLLAAPAFVGFAYVSDPATMTTVADLPSPFLQLMGISAAGYVGGKIVRGAGPKVIGVTCTPVSGPPATLTLSVRGSDIQTKGAACYLRDLTRPDAPDVLIAAPPSPSSKIDTAGMASTLDLSVPAVGLRTAPAAGGPWHYRFTVVTADGERAEWEF